MSSYVFEPWNFRTSGNNGNDAGKGGLILRGLSHFNQSKPTGESTDPKSQNRQSSRLYSVKLFELIVDYSEMAGDRPGLACT
jgi:hypothetical protein